MKRVAIPQKVYENLLAVAMHIYGQESQYQATVSEPMRKRARAACRAIAKAEGR